MVDAESNRTKQLLPASIWLARLAGKMTLCCPLGIDALCLARVKFVSYPIRLKVKSAYEPMVAGVYPGFFSMNRLGVFLLSPGWEASPSQGYPPALNSPVPIIQLGGERHRKSKVSCPRTQHDVRSQGSSPDHSLRSRAH